MIVKLKFNRDQVARALRTQANVRLEEAAEKVGDVLVSQTKRRFEESGDEEQKWPELWVNTVDRVDKQTRFKRDREERNRQVQLAEKYQARIKKQKREGKISGQLAKDLQKRARRRLKLAGDHASPVPDAYRGAGPIFRQGGKPLLDRGTLRNSIRSGQVGTPTGANAEVGSPLERLRWHHFGFRTKGPNYIPLTAEARKGWKKWLVPGMDYIVARNGVTVPPRPTIRITAANRREIELVIVEVFRNAARRR